MGWVSILYIAVAALFSTIAGIYITAWLMQREEKSYLLFALLAVSISALAATELWALRAQTADQYAVALRWLHVPTWGGFIAVVGLVYLRLRPRFAWIGGLAVALRTISLVPNFVTGVNINHVAMTGFEQVTLLGESVAKASGIPNPWMITAQGAVLLSLVFVLDGGISAWRRKEGMRALVLSISLFVSVAASLILAVLVFWGIVEMPFLMIPFFLVVAALMGAELSFGLLRAARAERDIELKDAALSISEQRLKLAAEAANAGFWSLDWGSGEVWASTKTRELFGLAPAGDVYLGDILDRIHMRDRAQLEQLFKMAPDLDDGYRAELRVVGADGQVRWLDVRGRSIGTRRHEPETLMGVAIDITARKTMQDEVREQRARLEFMSKKATLAELATVLAHEINQPLSVILTNAEAAQSLLAAARPNLTHIKQILADIVSADRRAADVIRHLRGLAERGELQREALSLHETIDYVLRVLASEIEDNEMTVDLSLAPDLPSVQADPVLIQQVLLNLLNNACTALLDRPVGERRLSIVTRAQGDDVLLEVTDSGCGLPDAERVFDPFYSTRPGGLGMGLTIVRSIVGSHRGRAWAESAPSHGTSFYVSLPRDGAAA